MLNAACFGFNVANASRADETSFVKRAITLQAASCWYIACDNSCRAVCNCDRIVKL